MREQKLIASRGMGMGFVVHVLSRLGISELFSSLDGRVVLWQVFSFCLWTSGRFLPPPSEEGGLAG